MDYSGGITGWPQGAKALFAVILWGDNMLLFRSHVISQGCGHDAQKSHGGFSFASWPDKLCFFKRKIMMIVPNPTFSIGKSGRGGRTLFFIGRQINNGHIYIYIYMAVSRLFSYPDSDPSLRKTKQINPTKPNIFIGKINIIAPRPTSGQPILPFRAVTKGRYRTI